MASASLERTTNALDQTARKPKMGKRCAVKLDRSKNRGAAVDLHGIHVSKSRRTRDRIECSR